MADIQKTNAADPVSPTEILTDEEKKKRGQRNLAIALSLAGFIVLIFLVTIFRLGGAVAERSF